MSLMMAVTPAVLIPRPETELLVEEVLHWLVSREAGAHPVDGRGAARRCEALRGAVFDQPLVADVGTGSGAIAVSLAHYHMAVQVIAVDISDAALDVAASNAGRHGLTDRISFLAGDLLAPLLEWGDARVPGAGCRVPSGRGAARRGTAVVANLPYIPTAAWDRLPPEVQREPRLALDGGGDGLDLYRRLLPQAAAWLAPGGLLACEIGLAQADVLIGMLQQGGWQQVRLIRDYRGEERVVTAHTAEHGVCGRLHDDQLSDG
jgi:release factor glutamine methyltransferase